MTAAANRIGLVVCDLAGTVVDYGSRAPIAAFIELFSRHGVKATEEEARIPMGKHKRDHIEHMLTMPAIAEQWKHLHGGEWTVGDLDALFQEFLPLQTDILDAHSDIIPGAVEALELWRSAGIKVAATTGYNRPMTDRVLAAAARQGLTFDFSCCAAEVPAGRPAPWMMYRCMEAAGVYPPSRVLKIGDTLVDMEEGRHAGAWTVGASKSGNMLGQPGAAEQMAVAGAHMVVDSVADATRIMAEFTKPHPFTEEK